MSAQIRSFAASLFTRIVARLVLVSLIAAPLLVYGVGRFVEVRHGLEATYFDGPEWRSDAAPRSYVDSPPSTGLLKERRPDFVDHPFSVEWRGFITIPLSGTYAFRTVSDDGSWLYVRGREVVVNGGQHSAADARGTIDLKRGVSPIFIRYSQNSGDCAFELWWSRNGGPFQPVPAWVLLTERVWYGRVLADRVTGYAFIVMAVACYLAVVGTFLGWAVRTGTRLFGFRRGGTDPAFGWVLLLSVLLNTWGIWFAMPNTRGWAPDELVPPDVLAAFRSLFSHGWAGKYPPFHYMVLSAADSPLLLLSGLGLVDLDATVPHVSLALIGRLVSVACGAATISLVHRCGLELYGRRGAMFAALTAALTLPFAYHSKIATLDVPYLFWFAVSLLAYIRILRSHARRDYLLFAASAALAGCTKDQAWGLFALTSLAILAARWQRWKQTGGPAMAVVFDGTTVRAVALGVAVFLVADNLLFNFGGFVEHVRIVFGMPGALDLHEFPATVAGELQMAWRAIQEMRYMFGWPLAIIVAVAVFRGMADATTRPSLRWVLVPAVSYYVVFLAAVLFIVDRYLMPITLVLSLCAGWWLERFLAPGAPARRARLALVWMAFAYSALYVAAVDYQMTTDSRYTLTRWLHGHVRPDQVIGSLGPLEYVTLADGFRWQSIDSADDVAAVQPAFIVLNADQIPHSSGQVQALHESLLNGHAGYRLVSRFRTPWLPLPGLHPDLGAAPRRGLRDFSDLNMINPTMEVFEPAGAWRPSVSRQ